MKLIRATFLLFWLLAELASGQLGKVPPVAPRGWSYYAFDDFETTALRPRWYVRSTELALFGGKVSLTNRNSEDGFIALKGLYKVNEPRIFLRWPWAAETRMIRPQDASAAFNGGISIAVRKDGGWSGEAEIGQIAPLCRSFVYFVVGVSRACP